jgi:hypothetical protein
VDLIKSSQKNKFYYVNMVVLAQDCFQWQVLILAALELLGFVRGFVAPQLHWYTLDQLFMNVLNVL